MYKRQDQATCEGSGYCSDGQYTSEVDCTNALATWTGSYGIYGQRYDASGNKITTEDHDGTSHNEFRVNLVTSSFQSRPSVAALTGLNGGGFVVTWHSYGQDGSSYGVYWQRYDSGGNKVSFCSGVTSTGNEISEAACTAVSGTWSSEFLINSDMTAEHQADPSVVGLNDGDFVVAWELQNDPQTLWDIWFQKFSSSWSIVE